MTTQSTATSRQGRGWERLVERIHEAPDQTSFLAGMLQLQCMIVAADYGAIWLVDPQNKLVLADTWPTTLAEHGPDSTVVQMLQQAATTALQRGCSQILKLHIGDENPEDANAPTSMVYVTVMRSGGRITAVSTAVGESRDAKVAKVTQPMRELAAGLFESFEAKEQARMERSDAEAIRQAMALLAVSQEARGFRGACLNVVNELARQQKCSRVSLGWVKGRSVRVVAMSDTEHLKRHDEQVTLTEMAMSECLDQQQPIVQPTREGTEPLLAQAVVHAHRRVTGDHPNKHVMSVPLRHSDDWLGVLMLERTETPFDARIIHQLQLVADVLAPHLADRRQSDRFLITHGWHSSMKAAGYLVGPKHVAWKLLGILILSLLGFVAFGTWPYHVRADFVLEAQDKRIVPAPYDGKLEAVMVQPGEVVREGDTLAQLDTTEFRLQLAESTSELKRASLERTQATAEGKLAEAQQAQARLEQARSHITLLQHHIERARIRAPVSGFVLSGYWHDKVGGVIEHGKPMFEVAPIQELVALVRVGETDIDLVDKSGSPQTGQLATRSVPEEKFDMHVIRMVPLASPVDGANVFEVRCQIENPAPWLRPGMEGLARIKVGKKPIYWILTHRIVNTVRLWLWL